MRIRMYKAYVQEQNSTAIDARTPDGQASQRQMSGIDPGGEFLKSALAPCALKGQNWTS